MRYGQKCKGVKCRSGKSGADAPPACPNFAVKGRLKMQELKMTDHRNPGTWKCRTCNCKTWKCNTNVVLIATWKAVNNGACLLYLTIKLTVICVQKSATFRYKCERELIFVRSLLHLLQQEYWWNAGIGDFFYWRARPITTLSKRRITARPLRWIHPATCSLLRLVE